MTGGKNVRGRKRHIVVDTAGNLLRVLVHSAGWSESAGGLWLLEETIRRFPSLLKIWADQGYRGELVELARTVWQIDLKIVEREPGQKGFVVLPRRWVVERALAWSSRSRRLSKDYERLPAVSETLVYITSIHRLLRRLCPDPATPLPYRTPAA